MGRNLTLMRTNERTKKYKVAGVYILLLLDSFLWRGRGEVAGGIKKLIFLYEEKIDTTIRNNLRLMSTKQSNCLERINWVYIISIQLI